MSSHLPPPPAEAQLTFLAKLQRLFAEGDFTATYKFALLITLADLAVEQGSDDGGPFTISIRDIAVRFIALYWHHVAPFREQEIAGVPVILSQNNGAQAAVLSAISEFRARTGVSAFRQAAGELRYTALVGKVAAVVSAQPVNYLQNFGGVTDPFLYERAGPGRLTLKTGVSFCLRRFYPLVQQLARNHWVSHIKSNRRNLQLLGEGADLESFLFCTSRQSLAVLGSQLRKLDGARCFYCGSALVDHDVDHFVPFSMYPRDLASNFVLAHQGCNRSKSDSLAAKGHLERWLERLKTRAPELREIGEMAGIPDEQDTVLRVAAWGYGSALKAGGRAWRAPSLFEALDETYLKLLHTSPALP